MATARIGKHAKKMEFIRLRAEGLSLSAIAGQLKVSKATLVVWKRELSADIAEEEQESLAEIKTALKLSRLQRAEALGRSLGRLRREGLQRDLGTVPTEKLLDLTLKFESAAAEALGEHAGKPGTESGPNLTARAQIALAEEETQRYTEHFLRLMLEKFLPCVRDAYRDVNPTGDVNGFLTAFNTRRKRINFSDLDAEARKRAKQISSSVPSA